jgi:amino acid transporter
MVIAVLTLLNVLGTVPGKWTQNVLTVAKVLGLAGIIAAGLLLVRPDDVRPAETLTRAADAWPFLTAMMLVLYAFDGWNEAGYVSSEVRDARRNVPRALNLGTGLVTVLYVLVNLAYLVGLGFDAARGERAGENLLRAALGDAGSRVVIVLALVAILGSLNGTMFTGSRLFAELGADHRAFAALGSWGRGHRAPVGALLTQAGISLSMVLVVWAFGRNKDGFESLVKGTAPVFWLFLTLTALSVFVLRWTDPDSARPFRAPLYPVTPLIFCAWSGYMLFASAWAYPWQALAGLGLLVVGVPLNWLPRRERRTGPAV